MHYRKKPVVIEALQYGPYSAPSVEMAAFLSGAEWGVDERGILIKTLEGEMLASIGDFIIRGVKGEFYPCKPDIFNATYEPVAALETKEGRG
jgi:hypothetical protein